jgi:hypothetical protein
METLNRIQKELKAPKSQFNAFGKYNYRKCEDILEAVKPLLGKATLIITDEVVMIGNRFYVKAVATLTEGEKSISATSYARESEEKKGMDAAMVTGASSSYARKYALSGLFCIDDNADADATHNGNGNGNGVISDSEKSQIVDLLTAKNISLDKFCSKFQIKELAELPKAKYQQAIVAIEGAKAKVTA